MGGIAGIIYPDVFQMNPLLDRMLDSLKHRNSNIKDTIVYKNIHLGVCGNTSFTNEKKNISALLDGNIYNHLELQNELKKEGFHFVTSTSAELLVRAYEAWGEKCFDKIDGDFALAIFDYRKDTLFWHETA